MIASPQHRVRHAAGSLRAALTDLGNLFAAETGHEVEPKFGPSGLLKDVIAGGSNADMFASANLEHPRAPNRSNRSGPVYRFALTVISGAPPAAQQFADFILSSAGHDVLIGCGFESGTSKS